MGRLLAHDVMLQRYADVRAVAADLHKAGLGLSAEDEARIVNEVQFVIHSAASISFFEHIHTLLEQNYEVRLRFTFCLSSHIADDGYLPPQHRLQHRKQKLQVLLYLPHSQ